MAPTYIRNWAGNQRFRPRQIESPATEHELAAIVNAAASRDGRVKLMGAGHSFTGIAVTNDVHVTIGALDRLHEVDSTSGLVTVGAGITLRQLNRLLDDHGLAMTNLGDIDVQSLAGAISTGTHGTGLGFGGLGTQVVGLRLMGPDGEQRDIDASTDAELFACARVGLGALGIITRVTLQCVPAFRIHAVEGPEPLDEVLEGWTELIAELDHFEFFWLPGSRIALTKRNTRTDEPRRPLRRTTHVMDKIVGENLAFGALCRVGRRFPGAVPTVHKLVSSTPTRREYVDRSFDVFTSRRWVKFYETEWSIPLDALCDTVREVDRYARSLAAPITFPVEVRCAAADDIPLSTANGRPRGYFACHVYQGTAHDEYFNGVADIARSAGGRPHWGKLHPESATSLTPLYPDWDRFQKVRSDADPGGRFTNAYLDRVLGPVSG